MPSLGLVSHTLSKFVESCTQSISPVPSQLQCLPPPTLEHTALALQGYSGTQRAVSGLEEMPEAASAA